MSVSEQVEAAQSGYERAHSGVSRPEWLVGKLLESLRSGSLNVGDLLAEKELSSNYRISRGSVRAALQQLQHFGVVDVVRGRGWRVESKPPRDFIGLPRQLSEQSTQILELRMSIEPTAASLAAVRAKPENLALMAEINATYRDTDDSLIDTVVRLDEEFHSALVNAANSPELAIVHNSITPRLRQFRRASYTARHSKEASCDEHRQILSAIHNGDSLLARRMTLSHLWALYDDVRRTPDQILPQTLEAESIHIFG